jgi:hypothetical protein
MPKDFDKSTVSDFDGNGAEEQINFLPIGEWKKFNLFVKTIGKKTKLGRITIKGNVVEKSEQISTHTACRSFATNALSARSMQIYEVMNCSHKSESSFIKYLKLNGIDYAKLAAERRFLMILNCSN